MSTSGNSQKGSFTGSRPLFYYITDSKRLDGISFDACVRRALNWGVDYIQIREKDLSDRDLFERTLRVTGLSRGTQCRILVNGRADIALAAGAHGVHLPSNSLPVSKIRAWVPEGFLIGKSVHREHEILQACDDGVDYLLLGHLFPTPSKTTYGPPLGMDYLRKICAQVRVPVFALGGIIAERIEQVLAAGAAGAAGISLFQKSDEFSALESLYPSRR